MKKMKIIFILVCIILVFVLTAGCLNLAITNKFTVNKDAQISSAEYDLTMDCQTYDLLEMGVQHQGFDSVKDAIEANLSKSLGTENVVYNEIVNTQNKTVTISLTRTDTYSPPADSKISIQKDGDNIVFQDNSFNSPQASQAFAAIGTAPTFAMPSERRSYADGSVECDFAGLPGDYSNSYPNTDEVGIQYNASELRTG